MSKRLWSYATILAASLTTLSAAPQSRRLTLSQGHVRLQVRAVNAAQPAMVRVTFLEADTLRGLMRELPLPVDLEVPGVTIRLRVEPVRPTVTTTVAEFWYGGMLVTRGEVTGVGGEVQVERGNLAMRTAPRQLAIVPLGPQP